MDNRKRLKYTADGAKLNLVNYINEFSKTEEMYYDVVCCIKKRCEDCLEACDEFVIATKEKEKKIKCGYDKTPYESYDKEYHSDKFKTSKADQNIEPVNKTDNLTILLDYFKKVKGDCPMVAETLGNISHIVLSCDTIGQIFPDAKIKAKGYIEAALALPPTGEDFDLYIRSKSDYDYIYIGGIWWTILPHRNR